MPAGQPPKSEFSTKGLVALGLGIAVLYFAKGVLIPFALALLIAFLLSPAVSKLESWKLPRIPAVLVAVLLTCGGFAAISWLVSRELLVVVENLPTYKVNIDRKMKQLQERGSGLGAALQTFRELGESIDANTPKDARQPASVRIVQRSTTFEALRDVLGPLLVPLEQSLLVLIFALFILIDRAELRNRLIKLAGHQQIHVTTQAMDDAGTRVTKYVQVQSLINASFGVVVGLGLSLAGIPSAPLWGVLAALLRFVPYLGVLIAGAMPVFIAFAASDGWSAPGLTAGIFLTAELITGNLIEPLLLGSHTGLSSIAILLSAVFWAIIWGPVGLILSTPLTVCLSVLGRYSPELRFLDVLLGDEPALSADVIFYQRLIALDHEGAFLVLESELKAKSVAEIYDEVVIPALVMAKRDRHNGALSEQKKEFLIGNVGECIAEISELAPSRAGVLSGDNRRGRVFAVPSSDDIDESVAGMFAQLAESAGYPAMALPLTDSPIALLQGLSPEARDLIYLASAPPLALRRARQLSLEIRNAFPDVTLVVGLWGNPRSASKNWERVKLSFGGQVALRLSTALEMLPADGTVHAEVNLWQS